MADPRPLLRELIAALDLPAPPGEIDLPAGGSLPSTYRVSDLAQASVGAAAAALSALVGVTDGSAPPVRVDRDLAAHWFAWSLRPDGWSLPPTWDAVAGDYRGADGWIRLHTNAPHHRTAALAVLGAPAERDAVAAEVGRWKVDELETVVVKAGGAAAALRSPAAWALHPQGAAVAGEPVMHVVHEGATAGATGWGATGRPLSGVKVLDLTRVLAGPVATRLLAGWGADVLRIDPPDWDEPPIVPEVTLGKRCARLDLRADRDTFLELLRSADVLVHGYRSDALERLGLGAGVRREARPDLVDVSLDAYGWTGPWATRRGFDSLVQMSSGIADGGDGPPTPLPVQALDHATGYLLAGAAISGLAHRRISGRGSRWRTSLARTAAVLVDAGPQGDEPPVGAVEATGPLEETVWGPARRLPPPVVVEGAPLRFERAARPLGADPARW